jgi:threonine/homoserine/homoserine lactone efflux protein
MDLSALFIFAGALAIAAGSPGPSIAALVARVISRGYQGVIPFIAAMWIGEAIWLALAVFGLAVIAQTFHLAFLIIKYAGLCYLAYLAYKMWTAPVAVKEDELPKADSSFRLFLTGLAITLGNPKIMIFYMALLPTIIDLAHVSLIGWGELTATMFVVLAGVDLAYVVLAGRARAFIRSAKAMRLANRCSALAMGGAAVAMATR